RGRNHAAGRVACKCSPKAPISSQPRNQAICGCRFRLFWTIKLRIQHLSKTSSCRAVDAIAARCVSDGKTPGIAVGIMQDGRALLEEGYGTANLEHEVRAKRETVFRIASLTKQFTATGILLLAQESLLSTKDKLSRFFPEFPRSDEVTIRQLLTHTS